LKKKIVGLYFVTFTYLWAANTPFFIGRHENKENRSCYFGLRIFLTIQIQLLEIESPKNPKIDSPYYICTAVRVLHGIFKFTTSSICE
jgi:hypothetical protein